MPAAFGQGHLEEDYRGVHITVYQNGKSDFTCSFVRDDQVEHHDLHPALADIRVAMEHAKALLDN